MCLLSINKIALKFQNSLISPSISGSTVSAITREKDGRVYANSDKRKAGGVAGFWKTKVDTNYEEPYENLYTQSGSRQNYLSTPYGIRILAMNLVHQFKFF